MMKSLFAALAIAALSTAPAGAAPCRDAKGKFVKCSGKPAAKAAKCKDAKGRFAKCSTAGAKPV